jgi:hypothetical protein
VSSNGAASAASDVLGNGGSVNQVVQGESAVDQENGDDGENGGVDQVDGHDGGPVR